MKVLLLVDYSNVLYRAYFSSVFGIEVRPWLPVLRYIDMMRTCIQRIQHRYEKQAGDEGVKVEVIFAGESRKPLRRTEIDPSYKSQRRPTQDELFRKFRQVISVVLDDCGWKIVSQDGAEADDVIASIAVQSQNEELPFTETQVVIFSNDRDLRQLIEYPNVSIYQHPGTFYTREQFITDYGITPDKFVAYKALVGDKSDNICGVFGWGPAKTKKHILAGDWIDELEKDGLEDDYMKALELVSLDFDLEIPLSGKVYNLNKNFNCEEKLRELYLEDLCFEEVKLSLLRLEEVCK